MKRLKDVLKEQGRTQVWLAEQLSKQGIDRDKGTMSLYCTGERKPRDLYVSYVIADILGVKREVIVNCFK